MANPKEPPIPLSEIPQTIIEGVEEIYRWSRENLGEFRDFTWPTAGEKDFWWRNAKAYAEQRPVDAEGVGRITLWRARGTADLPKEVHVRAEKYNPGRSRRGYDESERIVKQVVDNVVERARPELTLIVEAAVAPVLQLMQTFATEAVRAGIQRVSGDSGGEGDDNETAPVGAE